MSSDGVEFDGEEASRGVVAGGDLRPVKRSAAISFFVRRGLARTERQASWLLVAASLALIAFAATTVTAQLRQPERGGSYVELTAEERALLPARQRVRLEQIEAARRDRLNQAASTNS